MKINIMRLILFIVISFILKGCATYKKNTPPEGSIDKPQIPYPSYGERITRPPTVPYPSPDPPKFVPIDVCTPCLQRYNNDLYECHNFASSISTVEGQDEAEIGCLQNKGWIDNEKPCNRVCADQ